MQEGMDIAICTIDQQNKKIEYAERVDLYTTFRTDKYLR